MTYSGSYLHMFNVFIFFNFGIDKRFQIYNSNKCKGQFCFSCKICSKAFKRNHTCALHELYVHELLEETVKANGEARQKAINEQV